MRNSGAVRARYSASLPISHARIIQLDAETSAAGSKTLFLFKESAATAASISEAAMEAAARRRLTSAASAADWWLAAGAEVFA